MVQSDSELIAACRSGDANAWEVLVLRYQRLVYTIPSRAGLDEQQAAEVFQTVFVKLLEQLPRIDQPDRVRAWLVTTAKRETWQLLRQQAKVGLQISSEEEAEALASDTPLPYEVVQQLEEQHLVRTALEQLEERCRKLLTLLFYQETPVPYADVAAAAGIPAGSIGPTRARCLEKLRRILGSLGFDHDNHPPA